LSVLPVRHACDADTDPAALAEHAERLLTGTGLSIDDVLGLFTQHADAAGDGEFAPDSLEAALVAGWHAADPGQDDLRHDVRQDDDEAEEAVA
jgi:hypothetical protein